jgi:hypothetical protein
LKEKKNYGKKIFLGKKNLKNADEKSRFKNEIEIVDSTGKKNPEKIFKKNGKKTCSNK